MRLIKAYLAAMSASLELYAAKLREDTKTYAEREYWRGYAEGVSDARQEQAENSGGAS